MNNVNKIQRPAMTENKGKGAKASLIMPTKERRASGLAFCGLVAAGLLAGASTLTLEMSPAYAEAGPYQNLPATPGVIQPEILYADPETNTGPREDYQEVRERSQRYTQEAIPSSQSAGAEMRGMATGQGDTPNTSSAFSQLPAILQQTAGQMTQNVLNERDKAREENPESSAFSSAISLASSLDGNTDEEKRGNRQPSQFNKDGGASIADIQDLVTQLSQPNAAPLTISQLAMVNDALKRMQYAAELETKLQEMNLGLTSSSGRGSQPPSSSLITLSDMSSSNRSMPGEPPVTMPGRGDSPDTKDPSDLSTYSVIRLIGTNGEYAALIYHDGQQATVRAGDTFNGARIKSISMRGVEAVSMNGRQSQTLSFAAPPVLSSIGAYTRTGRE